MSSDGEDVRRWIALLWSLEDALSVALMAELYATLHTAPPSQALARAQRAAEADDDS